MNTTSKPASKPVRRKAELIPLHRVVRTQVGQVNTGVGDKPITEVMFELIARDVMQEFGPSAGPYGGVVDYEFTLDDQRYTVVVDRRPIDY